MLDHEIVTLQVYIVLCNQEATRCRKAVLILSALTILGSTARPSF